MAQASKIVGDEFEFWPLSMLPAWVVADRDLVIRNYNPFAYELLEAFGKEDLLAGQSLTLELSNKGEYDSLWSCILDPQSPSNFQLLAAALKILKRHFRILENFGKNIRSMSELLNKLNEVEGVKGSVMPYVFRPKPPQEFFRIGVKVSPSEGLRLIKPVNLENVDMEYVDLVIAYRVCVHWSGPLMTELHVEGAQPALHDVTMRHHLWEQTETNKRTQITTFLSHAFQTPISNIKSIAGELRKAPLEDYYLKRFEKLLAQIDDLGHLSELIVFISTSDKTPTAFCSSIPQGKTVWEYVTVHEVKAEIHKTLQSVLSGRTRDKRNERKVELLTRPNNKQLSEGQKVSPVLENSDNILEMRGITDDASFGLILPPECSWDVARRVKTTLLNLLLVELLLNAIKSADPEEPLVKIVLELNDRRLNIHVINNGLKLKKSEFHNIDELAQKPGEKRKALGHKLNKIATGKLDWKLEWREPADLGTHLVLSIPHSP